MTYWGHFNVVILHKRRCTNVTIGWLREQKQQASHEERGVSVVLFNKTLNLPIIKSRFTKSRLDIYALDNITKFVYNIVMNYKRRSRYAKYQIEC